VIWRELLIFPNALNGNRAVIRSREAPVAYKEAHEHRISSNR
jgi:hypothetical protein